MPRQIFVCREEDPKTEVSHNKYWIVAKDPTDPQTVLVWNGRLGSAKGATQPPRHENSQWDADRYIQNKIAEKRGKGYVEVDEHKFQQLTIQSSVVGLNNKVDAMTWVERQPLTTDMYMPVPEDRLMQPDYDPALLVVLQTKKPYAGQTSFVFLFTPDASYYVPGLSNLGPRRPLRLRLSEIGPDSPLQEISGKVEAGIATVFTGSN